MDLVAIDEIRLYPRHREFFTTGWAIEIESGFEGQIRTRSGMARGFGIIVLNSPGTIDSDYRGELGVLLYNASPNDIWIRPGDRIAQLVIAPVALASTAEVEELSTSPRGDGGWGSTGIAQEATGSSTVSSSTNKVLLRSQP